MSDPAVDTPLLDLSMADGEGLGSLDPSMSRLSTPYILLVIAPLMWAGNFIVGRGLHDAINPWAMTELRWMLAASLISPWAVPIAWQHRRDLWAARRPLLGLAITGVVLFQALLYEALRTAPAVNNALIMATMPLLIPLVAFLLFRDRVNSRQTIGIVVSMVGAGLIVTRGDPMMVVRLELQSGDALVFACVVAWSFYSNLIRLVPKSLPPLAVFWTTAVIGIVILFPIVAIETSLRPTFAFTPDVIGAIAYVAIGPSIIAFLCWNIGVAGVGATRAGLFIHLIPVFTIAFAIILLGESLEAYHLIGATIVLLGILIVTRAQSHPQRRS